MLSVKAIKNNQIKKVAKIKKKKKRSEPEENMVTWTSLLTVSYLRSLKVVTVQKKLLTTMVFTWDSETC